MPHGRSAGPLLALTVLFKVFAAWIPYFVSGSYSCGLLPSRDPKATTLFISIAVAVGIVAACLNLNLFRMNAPPAQLAVLAGVTIALLATARLCASIWRDDVADWNDRQ
jgi:hypothetical protein